MTVTITKKRINNRNHLLIKANHNTIENSETIEILLRRSVTTHKNEIPRMTQTNEKNP